MVKKKNNNSTTSTYLWRSRRTSAIATKAAIAKVFSKGKKSVAAADQPTSYVERRRSKRRAQPELRSSLATRAKKEPAISKVFSRGTKSAADRPTSYIERRGRKRRIRSSSSSSSSSSRSATTNPAAKEDTTRQTRSSRSTHELRSRITKPRAAAAAAWPTSYIEKRGRKRRAPPELRSSPAARAKEEPTTKRKSRISKPTVPTSSKRRDPPNKDKAEEEKDEDIFDVEEILGHKRARELVGYEEHNPDELLFEVKWTGYDNPNDNTWEPIDNVKFCDKFQAYCNQYLVPSIGRIAEDDDGQETVAFDFVEPVEGLWYYLSHIPNQDDINDDDESDIRGDTDFRPLDETDTAFNPPALKKQKSERRSRPRAPAKPKPRRQKKDPERELANRMLQRLLNNNEDPDWLLNELLAAEEEARRVAAAAENEDFFGGAPTIEDLLRNDEDVYYADVVLGIHNDDVEPEVQPPPQKQSRSRKRNATAAPPKPAKEKKSLKKAVQLETPTQTFTTRSMAAAAACGTTFFASLENPSPADDLIVPTSSTVVPQQLSPTDTNSFLQSSVLDSATVSQPSILNPATIPHQPSVLDSSTVPQQPSILDSATVPQQSSTADVSSSTVPQPSIYDDVFYTVDDIFYETSLPSTANDNSATVPPQPSMNADDNLLLPQSILETPAVNFVNQESYQTYDQMEYVAGLFYSRSDGAYAYFNGEVMIPVDENGMPEYVDYPSVPEAVVDPSNLPTSSSTSLFLNEISYPLVHSDTPSEEEMNHPSLIFDPNNDATDGNDDDGYDESAAEEETTDFFGDLDASTLFKIDALNYDLIANADIY